MNDLTDVSGIQTPEKEIKKIKKNGAPYGNKNAAKPQRIWTDTLYRVAVQSNGAYLRRAALALFRQAMQGDVPAAREIADRLEGKAVQRIAGADGEPLVVEIVHFAGAVRAATQEDVE